MKEKDKKALERVKDMFSDVTTKDIDEQNITIYGIAMLDVIRVIDLAERQEEKIKKLEYDKKFYQSVIDEMKESQEEDNE